jgi:hypothetical protein
MQSEWKWECSVRRTYVSACPIAFSSATVSLGADSCGPLWGRQTAGRPFPLCWTLRRFLPAYSHTPSAGPHLVFRIIFTHTQGNCFVHNSLFPRPTRHCVYTLIVGVLGSNLGRDRTILTRLDHHRLLLNPFQFIHRLTPCTLAADTTEHCDMETHCQVTAV